MRIFYTGGQLAGLAGAFGCFQHTIESGVAYDIKLHNYLVSQGAFDITDNIRALLGSLDAIDADLILCVHGREWIPKVVRDKFLCINVHPFVNKYKGADPVGKALKDKETRCMVASHEMTDKLDEGKIIYSRTIDVKGKTRKAVYKELYPVYFEVVFETLEIIDKGYKVETRNSMGDIRLWK